MKITQIDIKYFSSSELHAQCDGVRHIKSLPHLSVVQATQGSYDISINNGDIFNTKNNGAFIAPSFSMQTITHHVNPSNGYMTAHWVFLDVVINGHYSLDDLFAFPTILPEIYQVEVNNIIDELNQKQGLSLSLSYLYRLIHILLKIGTLKTSKNPQIEKILYYIRSHYQEKINYDKFAKELYISKSSLFRIFKREFQKTPSEYINQYRIGVATQFLDSSDIPIKKIALSVGFDNEFYFSKLFKKETGLSPSKYREFISANIKSL